MKKRVAIVYDWFDKWGGIERVLLHLYEALPEAVFYTSHLDLEKASWARYLRIRSSFIDSFPEFIKKSRILSFPFYPYVFENFDLRDYDLVVSVTSAFAKSVITHPDTKHICYLLSPPRYLWSHQQAYLGRFAGYLTGSLKNWDKITAWRPDEIISISQTVSDRCLKYYGRKSKVLYPPFDKRYWEKVKVGISQSQRKKRQDYFLVVSRLEPYKKIDLAISAFNCLGKKLIVVGEGSVEKKLKEVAGKNIFFMKNLSDMQLGEIYSGAKALIMPQEEDFGLVSLESQFFGTPVIAYKKGGATETVCEGESGIFFEKQTKSSLMEAIERYEKIEYNLRSKTEKTALNKIIKYDKDYFTKSIKSLI